MNINKVLGISFIVLLLSSYETDSSFLFSLLMKMLMIKGALFMSMPVAIGSFVMGQGMGFFAGNAMGGYMMLRAANSYHNKEKTKWVTHSNWHGPPYYTNHYQKGYDKGKAIVDVFSAGKAKVNAIASIFKPFIPKAPKRPSRPDYGPPASHGTGWSETGGYEYSHGSHASHSNPPATMYPSPYPSPYPYPVESYGAPLAPSQSSPIQNNMFKTSEGSLAYEDYYPGGNRKNAFSTILSSLTGQTSSEDQDLQKNNRRTFTEGPIRSPSAFYTSAFATPGQEFTGILTNDPTSQGDKYLRGESDTLNSASPSSTLAAAVTSAPNEILESYLEQRLKAEAEKQKDMERKQEAQQLLQLLRKTYLKQLVDNLKEEEINEKKAASNRRLDSSPFASLSSSIESLFGSRESRSIERRNNNEVDVNNAKQTSQNLIRDLLVNEVFTSGEYSKSDNNVSEDGEKISTAEVESITERVMALSSSEREELVKGLDEFDDEEEVVITKPDIVDETTEKIQVQDLLGSASTENAISSNEGGEVKRMEEKKKEEKSDEGASVLDMLLPAKWEVVENTFSSETAPFAVRVKRQVVPLLNVPSSAESVKQGASNQGIGAASPEEQKQIQAFVNDIKKFFTLLSALDQDTCLQKLVCDVHTNEKDISTLTQYESNILTTFKLMKALMPEAEEDSSTKYRHAAVVGETGQSMDLCKHSYPSCGYSTNQIVALGTQQEATPMDWASMQGQAAAVTTAATEIFSTAAPETDELETQQSEMERLPQAQSQRRREEVPVRPPYAPMTRRRFQQQQPTQYQQYSQPQTQPQRQQEDSSSFFNYDEFSDYFRSLWSDSLMRREARKSRQYYRRRL